MSEIERLDELRELLLNAPIALNTLVLASVVSVLLLTLVLWLVRRRSLREEYTPIWLVATAAVVVISFWPRPTLWLTRAIGAWTQSSTLFFLALMFLVLISLNYAVRLSRLTLQVKNLSQEVTLLRADLDRGR